MPKCIVCDALLPPDFLSPTDDGLAKKCLFCIRGTDILEYYSEAEDQQKKTTKAEIINEYVILLKEISDMPNVTDILDALKEKHSGIIIA